MRTHIHWRAVLLAAIASSATLGAQSTPSARIVPAPTTEPARIELWPLQTQTMSDEAFLTGAKSGTPTTLAAELRLPSAGPQRVPAVVMLHGSNGVTPANERWAREMNGLGIATLLVDSFTGRGLTSTVEDQSQLGQMAMVFDAYRALELLAKHPRIDATRIGLFGNSKGGAGALYASVSRFQQMHAPRDAGFAVYISLYPPCTRQYIADAAAASRPIRIFHGTADVIAPIDQCRAYVKRLQSAGADVQLTEYEGAHHGFDGHQLPPLAGQQPGAAASGCDLYEEPAGHFINRATGRPFTPTDACLKRARLTGYDAVAHVKALENVRQILRQTLGSTAQPAIAQSANTTRNTAFIRQCLEWLTRSTVDQYMTCWAEEIGNNGRPVSRDRLRGTVEDIVNTFPDFKFTIQAIVAEGDTVVARVTQSGTHRGVAKTNFNGGGLTGVKPTGRRMEILATHWFTIRSGKIIEQQAVRDDLTMMRQLGLAPPPLASPRP